MTSLVLAVAASLVGRDRRSLALGILASASALGDLGSSLFVGLMLSHGHAAAAFAVPAAVGALGVARMSALVARGHLR